MKWIVLGENKGRIVLVSSESTTGMLPKGSFLTVDEGKSKFVLRVEDSLQHDPYRPSPLVVDMDLSPLQQDRMSKNLIVAYRVFDFSRRKDGLVDYIKPQSVARRSNQAEINLALSTVSRGPRVFVATIQYNQNQCLHDENGIPITATLPEESFYHQMLVCGKTGSGKTVAAKYLSQYFVEELEGAVLAINVKDVDLLKMDKPSVTKSDSVRHEWDALGSEPHGIDNFTIYYPANTELSATKEVSPEICKKITLDVKKIEPEALTGLLTKISDIGAMSFPDIFRSWQANKARSGADEDFTFTEFVRFFERGAADQYSFASMNVRGEESRITLHRGTYDNIMRNLNAAVPFFDNPDADTIDETDILHPCQMSVIDIAVPNGIQFGSILLRHLLHRIVEAKSEQRSTVPVLIVIDEVHMFYSEDASAGALGDLDTICRTGRSQQIGVIFSSQNPQDIPTGLSSVINTKIFFKSDPGQVKKQGLSVNPLEMEALKKGYAVAAIHDLSQLRILKFPLSYAGVFE